MKPDNIELSYKKYIQLEKRYNEVRRLIRNSPWRTLPEPYQDGWFLNIELSEAATKHKGSDRMKQAIELCAKKNFVTRNPEHVSKIRKKPKFQDVKALLTYKDEWSGKLSYHGPSLDSISEREWKKLTPEQLLGVSKWFEEFKHTFTQWGIVYNKISYVCTVPLNYLEVRARKRIVTQEQDINPALVKEEAEIEALLEPYWRTSGGYWPDKYYRARENREFRRHQEIAITRVMKNEITDINQHTKLSKYKKKI